VGAVLSQLGEGEEEVAVAVEVVLGTDLEMDGDGEVAQLADESASLGCEVVVAVVRSEMQDAVIDASVTTQVIFSLIMFVFLLDISLVP
jgi:hypothetical protein